jgi:hypothetical protein
MTEIRRTALLLLLVLCSAVLVFAQNQQEMNGTICNAQCVAQSPKGNPTCYPGCHGVGGPAVFVGDDGIVRDVENQDLCQSHMGKRVKMTFEPAKPPATEKQRENIIHALEIQNLNQAGG